VAKVEHLEQLEQQIRSLEQSQDKKRKRADEDCDEDGDCCRTTSPARNHSLPSFSTLFASTNMDKEPRSYLPSPPSSTKFLPVRTPQLPPTLTLDTEASNKPSSVHSRTPEDERAATLLLGISNSPPLPFPLKMSSSIVPSYELPGPHIPRKVFVGDVLACTNSNGAQAKPHTPSSFLGMGRSHKE
jgi:hypothetical protein